MKPTRGIGVPSEVSREGERRIWFLALTVRRIRSGGRVEEADEDEDDEELDVLVVDIVLKLLLDAPKFCVENVA